jgi:hypothetical protein
MYRHLYVCDNNSLYKIPPTDEREGNKANNPSGKYDAIGYI